MSLLKMPSRRRAVVLASIAYLAACARNRDDEMGAAPDRGDTTQVATPDTTAPPPEDTATYALPPDSTELPEDFARVPVLFATDRRRSSSADVDLIEYGSDRGPLVWGKAVVSIPKSHVPGHLEAPSIFRFEFRENPSKHIMLLGAREFSQAEWADTLRAWNAASPSHEVLVYIHGYNVAFEDAARRAAQLSYDIAFNGATVMYSWPSKGTLLGYSADEATVEWTITHLEKVLEQVVATTGVDRVHVIAHSMGNRALVRAVQTVASRYPGRPAFNQIILAAPDIDAGVYLDQIAPAIRADASRVTLYASSRDAALMASSQLHRFARAGYSGIDLVIADGIDTIDASAVDTDLLGHSYTVEEKEILDDLFNLLRHKMQPSGRNLRKATRGSGIFWSLP